MNRLMFVVLRFLAHKPRPLTKDELRFVRSHMEMTMEEFGGIFGISHVAVLKWEKGSNKISPALEFCIRLHILDYLKVKDKEFRALYKELNLGRLSKPSKTKVQSIVIDAATEDLKIAL
jgi:transcriptional regulator with XRE-family HTH domain